MTVAELIKELQKYPPDMQIVSTGVDCGGYDHIDTDIIEIWEWLPNQLYVGGIRECEDNSRDLFIANE